MSRSFAYIVLAGFAVCLFCAWINGEQFSRSFYYAFILWLSVSLGALAQIMTHHLTGGRWGFVVRRLLEAALAPLPLLAVLFFVAWSGTPALRDGEGYFAPGWIIARSIICFAVWGGLAWGLRYLSLRQDASSNPRFTQRLRTLSGPGLVLYFLTVSFAITDWLMKLEPGWRSTLFPGVMMATQTLMALSAATTAAVYLLAAETESIATPRAWLDLGTLLFAFVIFWAYVAFSQFLIIWYGNLPGETVWYRQRGEGGWEWLGWGIGAVCFFAPAAILLSQSLKRKRHMLARVAIGIFVSQMIYLFWVVVPAFIPSLQVSVMDILVPAGVGLIWSAFFWRAWKAARPLPNHDPRLEKTIISTPHQS